jgi:hypothetical protein
VLLYPSVSNAKEKEPGDGDKLAVCVPVRDAVIDWVGSCDADTLAVSLRDGVGVGVEDIVDVVVMVEDVVGVRDEETETVSVELKDADMVPLAEGESVWVGDRDGSTVALKDEL